MKQIFYTLLLKEFRFLKFIFVVLASYWIYEEFYTYLVLKPTFTTSSKRELEYDDFPEIIVCPEPAIDVKAAKSKGYREGIERFFYGMLEDGNATVSWSGNASEDVKKVYEELSILKSVEDCPSGSESLIYYKSNDIWTIQLASFTLYKARIPFTFVVK